MFICSRTIVVRAVLMTVWIDVDLKALKSKLQSRLMSEKGQESGSLTIQRSSCHHMTPSTLIRKTRSRSERITRTERKATTSHHQSLSWQQVKVLQATLAVGKRVMNRHKTALITSETLRITPVFSIQWAVLTVSALRLNLWCQETNMLRSHLCLCAKAQTSHHVTQISLLAHRW